MAASQPSTQSPTPEETGGKKLVLTVAQLVTAFGATFGVAYYIYDNLSQRENKLQEQVVKVADNLTAINASIRSVSASGLVTTQRVNENFGKVQGRLECIEKATKVFVPPSLSISVIQPEVASKSEQQ